MEYISKTHFVPSPCPHNQIDHTSNNNLIEFLSRPARKRIVECLCEALVEEGRQSDMGLGRKRRGRPHCSGATILASRLCISRKSVSRWLAGEMQSSNTNAWKILELGQEYVPDLLELILRDEIERHRLGAIRLLKGRGDGP
jgi:hypothetical protein